MPSTHTKWRLSRCARVVILAGLAASSAVAGSGCYFALSQIVRSGSLVLTVSSCSDVSVRASVSIISAHYSAARVLCVAGITGMTGGIGASGVSTQHLISILCVLAMLSSFRSPLAVTTEARWTRSVGLMQE
jgi:hypothetical protein